MNINWQILLSIGYVLLAIVPGLLIVVAAAQFNKLTDIKGKAFVVVGSFMMLIKLIIGALNYPISAIGGAEALANYAMLNAWLGGIIGYLGLLSLAIGLLIHTSTVKRNSKSKE